VLRPAVPTDVPEICALIHELAVYEQLEHEAVATHEDLDRWLYGPDARASVTIAELDGEVAGMALWFWTFSTFLGRPGIWLEDLFVRPAARGHGLGKALLEDLFERSPGRVEWAVLDWNESAIEFYRSLGAEPVAGWTRYRRTRG
jgi:GNAT superfamily N-acetyltransferase